MRSAVVVLGASNVSRGLARLAAVVRSRSTGPVDLFVTAGHGRSYGVASRVGIRRLPSILGCGLWRALDREVTGRDSAAHAPAALVTDVGNDLLYGHSAEQTAGWVRAAVGGLIDRGVRVAVTRLPLASILAVGQSRYRLLRACYVPGCRLALDELKDAAVRLDAALVDIAVRVGAAVIDQPGSWYGLDAIHVRRRHLDDLWHAAGDAWAIGGANAPTRATVLEWAALGSRAAEVR